MNHDRESSISSDNFAQQCDVAVNGGRPQVRGGVENNGDMCEQNDEEEPFEEEDPFGHLYGEL